MAGSKLDLAAFEKQVSEVADILRALANERRLMILCKLVESGEANVTSLADAVGLSQSALSQHLARMRDEGLVTFRRDGQILWYRIADPRIEQLFATLHELFCRTARTQASRIGGFMADFTPVSAFIGGLLIGTSAALFLVLNGRIAGISGILGGLIYPARSEIGWRLAFLAGLFAAPPAYVGLGGALPAVVLEGPLGILIVAGLIVGFGTRLGAGCTSGHGVCGIGRGSPRSLAATAVFMTTAILTVFVTRHVLAG